MTAFPDLHATQPPMHPLDRELIARGFALLYAAQRMPFAPLGDLLDHADWIAAYVAGEMDGQAREIIRSSASQAGRGAL
ncbi:MAG TPA: hypothetical protein VNS22_07140 [Geminicoccus sp.]|uniref:hypothetical protein n=1 Tax=Geminicoccus sp. TaxID=2024832 RepID=UPI002BE15A0D|nr:hypothetical protein [Geminicoccus sp.]HWL68146.1 hypothetical protein [Geminicoccus sp.]